MALLPPTTKVIFFIRICDSVHRGVGVPACLASHMTPPTEQNPPPPTEAGTPSRADTPQSRHSLAADTPPGVDTPSPRSREFPPPNPRDMARSGRYASYWNAYLFGVLFL